MSIGDVVEVKPAEEILAGLDERGELDSLPFMPEMLQFCGRRFVVDKIAFKTCDTATWTGLRRLTDTVHLAGVRCDGEAHGGCQAGCLIFWKTAWLTRVSGPTQDRCAPTRLELRLRAPDSSTPREAVRAVPGRHGRPGTVVGLLRLHAGSGSPRWPSARAARGRPRPTSPSTRARPPN